MISQGRFLNPLDIDEARKVAVIGTRVREVLFGPDEDPIGQMHQGRRIDLPGGGRATTPPIGRAGRSGIS